MFPSPKGKGQHKHAFYLLVTDEQAFVGGKTCCVFDQPTHVCACVRMVENDKKRSKTIKNILFSSCVREAHVRLK